MTALRGPQVASRVGLVLGIALLICFGTGLISHWIQHPPSWFVWPAHPVWLYRVTQGLHVTTGIAAIPLLLVKLWSVYPKLFEKPHIGSPVRMLERGSIAVLVGSVLFQLATGLLNIAQWYKWTFFFTSTHYAMAWVAIGALAVHIAVKIPVIRTALSTPLDDPSEPVQRQGISRRSVLVAAGLASTAAALAVAGQSVPFLRWVSVLTPRSGTGPQGVPVNRTAQAAGVADTARDDAYALAVTVGGQTRAFTRDQLLALPQTTAELPIACVEGWSASATWTGVRVRDLVAAAGGSVTGDVRMTSLERGLYGESLLPRNVADDDTALIALAINGETLDLDHGYPCRLIAPSRPGVLQTKWLSRVEVMS